MSEETLTDVLDDKADYLAYKRAKTVEKLGERTHLTLGKLVKLVGHPEHGSIVAEITLQELIDVQLKARLEELAPQTEDETETEAAPVARKSKKKTAGAKKKTKIAAKKKSTKKKATKKSVKKRSVAASSSSGRKADFGKKKPRLQRDQGYREILAALKAAGEPCGRGDLESATGYSGVQVRTFCKELAAQGKVQILGSGGRSTKYALA